MLAEKNTNMSTTVIALCDIAEGIQSLPGVGPIDFRRLFENVMPTTIFHVSILKNSSDISQLSKQFEIFFEFHIEI